MCQLFNSYLVLFLLILNVNYNCSFNLNTNHAIIYEDAHKQMGIVMETKSLFGYRTVLYPGDEFSKPWIAIGAPKGTDLNIPARNPGVVFKCGIKEPCEILTLESRTGDYTYAGSHYIDGKDNAWIGGSMDINIDANLMVVCGFRWCNIIINRNMQRGMLGMCYLVRLNTNTTDIEKLIPLLDYGKSSMVVNQGRSIYFYFLGQAGFSSHIINAQPNPQLLLGAPGVYNWAGQGVLFNNLNSPYHRINPLVSLQDYNKFSLFGYSSASGRFSSANDLLYVSAAPLGHFYMGVVFIYKFSERTDRSIHVKTSLKGSQMGEYFGFTLAVGDVNGDGYDDLFVGAPFFEKTAFNDGRVHVFYGSKNLEAMRLNEPVHLTIGKSRGCFGMAISYLGDLNQDGYGDIAVGAPFSNEGRGEVYIYHGSRSGVITTPSQVLQAQEIDLKLRGFGVSISNGVDIDRNGFIDIAIGAHVSGHAIIIRSNPIIGIISSISIKDGNDINVGNTTIQHCYTYNGNEYAAKYNYVRRVLIIDEHHRRVSLAPEFNLTREFMLKNECETFVITSKEKLHNLVAPVKITVGFEFLQEAPRKNTFYVGRNNSDHFCKTCPILAAPQQRDFEFSFALDCGGNMCNSKLHFDAIFSHTTEGNWFVTGTTDVIRMDIQIRNDGDPAYLTQLYVMLPPFVYFHTGPRKCMEYDEAIIECLVGNPLKNNTEYVSLFLNVKDVQQDIIPTLRFLVNITTSSENINPERTKSFIIRLRKEVDLVVSGKPIPALQLYKKNATFAHVYEVQKVGKSAVERAQITLHIPTQIVVNNIPQTFVRVFSIVGLLFGMPIVCKNNTYVEMIADTLDNNDQNFLEVDDESDEPRLLKRRDLDSEIVYSNNLNEFTTMAYVKNDNETEKEARTIEFERRAVILDCEDSNSPVICSTITCDIGLIRNEEHIGVVRVKALLEAELLKEYLKITDEIVLKGYATVRAKFETDTSNNVATITSFFKEEREMYIPLWWILLAVLGGILILLLLIYLMFRFGFFARKRKMQLEQEKMQMGLAQFDNPRLSGEPSPEYEEDAAQEKNHESDEKDMNQVDETDNSNNVEKQKSCD